MEAPSDDVREMVDGHDFETEDSCEHALDLIDSMLEGADLTFNDDEDPYEALGAIEAWAGLMSYAVASTYAPSSPMKIPGWSSRVTSRLRKIAAKLKAPLQKVANKIGAPGFSISASFPWGVSVSLNW